MDLIKPEQKISIFFQKEENIVEIVCTINKVYEDRISVELPPYFMRYIEFLGVGKFLTAKIFSKIGTIDFNTVVISSPLEDEFSIEFDSNAIKLTPNSEIPSVEAMEKLQMYIDKETIINQKTFVLSTTFIKFYSDKALETNKTYEYKLIFPKNYGTIDFIATITEVDPVYDNEYTAVFNKISEEDRQKLLYYMYVYSNNTID